MSGGVLGMFMQGLFDCLVQACVGEMMSAAFCLAELPNVTQPTFHH